MPNRGRHSRAALLLAGGPGAALALCESGSSRLVVVRGRRRTLLPNRKAEKARAKGPVPQTWSQFHVLTLLYFLFGPLLILTAIIVAHASGDARRPWRERGPSTAALRDFWNEASHLRLC